jgi:hypothetical protein
MRRTALTNSKPEGLKRFYLPQVELQPSDGQFGGPVPQLVELLCALFDQEHHWEAIRSRPMLIQGVGRKVQSGGERTVKVSILHEKHDLIANAVTLISKELSHICSISERCTSLEA